MSEVATKEGPKAAVPQYDIRTVDGREHRADLKDAAYEALNYLGHFHAGNTNVVRQYIKKLEGGAKDK